MPIKNQETRYRYVSSSSSSDPYHHHPHHHLPQAPISFDNYRYVPVVYLMVNVGWWHPHRTVLRPTDRATERPQALPFSSSIYLIIQRNLVFSVSQFCTPLKVMARIISLKPSGVVAVAWILLSAFPSALSWTASHRRRRHHNCRSTTHSTCQYFPASSNVVRTKILRMTESSSLSGTKNTDNSIVNVLSPPEAHTSLAGDYSIVISQNNGGGNNDELSAATTSWSLYSIDQVVAGEENLLADGARSMKALSLSPSSQLLKSASTVVQPVATLSCTWNTPDTATLSVSKQGEVSDVDDDSLLDLLQRILVQWSWALRATGESQEEDATKNSIPCTVSFFQQDAGEVIVNFSSSDDSSSSCAELYPLFAGLVDSRTAIEWVEMVTGSGQALGRVPRRLVHTYNLLHRGIGLFVTKDRPISPTNTFETTDFSSLYVHRRSSTKRVFPSLYDMFVGGVSLAGEPPELTARREVAEELGLAQALDENDTWDAPLLTCTVCTAYNRCVVTLFSYTMNSQDETITWQEEEVDWGSFVPYPVVVAAADRSIQRFANDEEWPGTYPPIQSEYQGELPTTTTTTTLDPLEYNGDDSWKEWDFVPDGLLVWEAWLHFLEDGQP